MVFRSKKALISKHRKNYIFWDNNCFVKMSVSLLVWYPVSVYVTNFCERASSKTSVNIKTKFQFQWIEIKSWLDFGAYRPKIKRGGVGG